MKVELIYSSDEFSKENDYRHFFIVKIDGREIMSFYDGEHEDNTLSRNFSDVYFVNSIIRAVYNCGKNGEELKISQIESDDDIY